MSFKEGCPLLRGSFIRFHFSYNWKPSPLSQTNSISEISTCYSPQYILWAMRLECWTKDRVKGHSLIQGNKVSRHHHKTLPCPISNTVTPPRSMDACHNVYCCFMDTSLLMPDTGRLWTTALAEHQKPCVFIEDWGQNLRHCSHLSISCAYTENNRTYEYTGQQS